MPKDPTKVPIQFNITIPWDLKEFLEDKAARERTSQRKLVMDALMEAYGVEFAREQAKAPR